MSFNTCFDIYASPRACVIWYQNEDPHRSDPSPVTDWSLCIHPSLTRPTAIITILPSNPKIHSRFTAALLHRVQHPIRKTSSSPLPHITAMPARVSAESVSQRCSLVLTSNDYVLAALFVVPSHYLSGTSYHHRPSPHLPRPSVFAAQKKKM